MRAAVDLAWVLWTAGTLGGLFTAMSIPYLMFTQYRVEADAAFGGWLMPVVPPMVSAATGALLIPHMAPGTRARDDALRLLRDVRPVADRVADHHHDGVEPAGALRHLGDRASAHAVDRARARLANPSPSQGFSVPTRPWPSTRISPTG